ncbi:MAG: TetR family transcriptional regulator [Lachnospiraceae bacterium]|nr:TetR family transcriptional regulator [Lachnospiraceae bacterium]MBQ2115292.1 TetR family transcriptional regulator [Lachnospiraceae bacterium]MBQ2406627.1 TetR family transcriptional regulator [Lachnospiraceae bacterium]MBQ5851851.1 TetR family transcriptional regulator [Lachnospiraceae bacterium]
MIYNNGEKTTEQMLIDDPVGRKILDAAISIIDQEGYENLTIRKVAKESGCSNSAIYMRFEDKDALAGEVAALHAKPFLMMMDDNYNKEKDFLTNINKITKVMLEKVFTFNNEAVHMQVMYRGGLKPQENPFVLRLEEYLKTASQRGEVNVNNTLDTAYLLSASFWGLAQMARANKQYDYKNAVKLLETQNAMLYLGIKAETSREDSLWSMLKEKGVNVDKALERMKGNKDAYKSFLQEFFEDPDFESLEEAIRDGDAKNAFDYAHGLKGMAANLGLDKIHGELSVLVEILRRGSLDGAKEAYDAVMEACDMVTMLL